MQYRSDKYGNPLSILGYGCMRFTARAGKIDLNKAEQEIMAAIAGGVNYFDTAYIYNGSEAALGEILRRNSARDKVNIATKLPHYLLKKPDSMEKFFQEELRRLQTRKKRRPAPSARRAFPTTAIPTPSANCWMNTIGIFARSSTITWTNTPRRAGRA